MLDFAWSELLVVIIVAVIVIGPKQLPEVLYGFGRIVRRLQYLKFAMSKQFEDFMHQADLQEIRDLKKNPFDMALHGIDEEDIEAERQLTSVIARSEATKQSSDGDNNDTKKNTVKHD
jgi:sec-independent protein translocase protein TatB